MNRTTVLQRDLNLPMAEAYTSLIRIWMLWAAWHHFVSRNVRLVEKTSQQRPQQQEQKDGLYKCVWTRTWEHLEWGLLAKQCMKEVWCCRQGACWLFPVSPPLTRAVRKILPVTLVGQYSERMNLYLQKPVYCPLWVIQPVLLFAIW